MHAVARRIIAAVELSRLPVAFGAVANVWLMVLLARTDPRLATSNVATMPVWQALIGALMLAVGFMAFGAALNDFLDAKHDRTFSPDRPLPAGLIAPRRAMQLAVIALCVGVLGAIPFGTSALLCAMLLAALILIYDAFAKHVPALGIVIAGLATAVSMFAPCVEATALLPVWIAMSQTMGVGLLAYQLADKRPQLSRRAVLLGAMGWIFWSAALFALGSSRNDGALLFPWKNAADLTVPAITVVACALIGVWKLRSIRGVRAAEKLLRYGSLWKSLVAAAWMFAADLRTEATIVAGIAIAIFAMLAILRETRPLLSEPTTWRS